MPKMTIRSSTLYQSSIAVERFVLWFGSGALSNQVRTKLKLWTNMNTCNKVSALNERYPRISCDTPDRILPNMVERVFIVCCGAANMLGYDGDASAQQGPYVIWNVSIHTSCL